MELHHSVLLVFALFVCINADALEPQSPLMVAEPKSTELCDVCAESPCDIGLDQVAMTVVSESEIKISGFLQITASPETDMNMELKLEQCQPTDTNCVDQAPILIEGVCNLLEQNSSMWGEFMNQVVKNGFSGKCPLNTGGFEFKEVPVKTNTVMELEPEPGMWHVQCRVYDMNEKLLMCVESVFKVYLSKQLA